MIAWFSGGITSAVAVKLSGASDIRFIDIDTHHPDTYRFLSDCEKWFGHSIKVLRSNKWRNQFEVIESVRFINSPAGASCTARLKKWERETGGVQVFGFDYSERDRALRICHTEPETEFRFPLIEESLLKEDCISILNKVGIELPEMYKLGYGNNNCIGCVKGGKGYWNKIRRDFPQVFDRMAKLERSVGASCMNGIYLDELPEDSGNFKPTNCGVLCLF